MLTFLKADAARRHRVFQQDKDLKQTSKLIRDFFEGQAPRSQFYLDAVAGAQSQKSCLKTT